MPAFSLVMGRLMNALNLTLDELQNEVSSIDNRFSSLIFLGLALWMVYLGIMSFAAYWGQYTFLNLAAIRQVKKLREAYLKAMLRQVIKLRNIYLHT